MVRNFFGGVLQNVFAAVAVAIVSLLLMKFGVIQTDNIGDLKNWPSWIIFAVAALVGLVTGANSIRLAIGRWRLRHGVKAASGNKLCVMIAKFDGDDKGIIRHAIRDGVVREFNSSVDLIVWPLALQIEDGNYEQKLEVVRRTAHSWLKTKRADILIWGQVRSADTVSLRITLLDGDIGKPSAHQLTPTVELPVSAIGEVAAALISQAVNQISRQVFSDDEAVQHIVHSKDKLEALLPHAIQSFSHDEIFGILLMLGDICMTLDARTAAREEVSRAIEVYERAREYVSKRDRPDAWLALRTMLATAYFIEWDKGLGRKPLEKIIAKLAYCVRFASKIGEIEINLRARSTLARAQLSKAYNDSDYDGLLRAATTLEEGLELCSPEHLSGWFVSFQSNLATVYCELGAARPQSQDWFGKARHAAEEALRLVDPGKDPVIWADALMTKADIVFREALNLDDAEGLYESIRLSLSALDRVDPHEQAVTWSRGQKLLGISYDILGKIRHEKAMFELSRSAYLRALSAANRANDPRGWAGIQENIAGAFIHLGEIEKSLEHFEKAQAALEAALQVYDQDTYVRWLSLSHSLAYVLCYQGQAKNDRELLLKSVSTIENVLATGVNKRDIAMAARINHVYGNALGALGDLDQGASYHLRATDALRFALEASPLDEQPRRHSHISHDLGIIYTDLARICEDDTFASKAIEIFDGGLVAARSYQDGFEETALLAGRSEAEALVGRIQAARALVR